MQIMELFNSEEYIAHRAMLGFLPHNDHVVKLGNTYLSVRNPNNYILSFFRATRVYKIPNGFGGILGFRTIIEQYSSPLIPQNGVTLEELKELHPQLLDTTPWGYHPKTLFFSVQDTINERPRLFSMSLNPSEPKHGSWLGIPISLSVGEQDMATLGQVLSGKRKITRVSFCTALENSISPMLYVGKVG